MKKPTIALLASFLAVVSLIGYHHFKKYAAQRDRKRASEARIAMKTEAEARELIDDLNIPPEAIYSGGGKIYELRRQAFDKYNVDEFLPYADQVRSRRRGNNELSLREHFRKCEEYGANTSLENYLYGATADACDRLAGTFRGKKSPLYYYFKQHPELYKNEIRPRLLLLANSRSHHIVLYACKALVAAGERTDFLRYHLTSFVMDSSYGLYSDVMDLLKECGYAAPDPWPTVESLPAYKNDKWTVKDTRGDPLPPGALHRITQNPVLLGNSYDGRTVYLTQASGPPDRLISIHRFDITSGELTKVTLDGPDKVTKAAVSDDGKLLATRGSVINPDSKTRWDKNMGRLMLWDTQTGKAVGEIAPSYATEWLRFDPSGSRLIAGGNGDGSHTGCTSVYSVPKRKLLYRLPVVLKSPAKFLLARTTDGPGEANSPGDMQMLGLVKNARPQALTAWSEEMNMRSVEFNSLIGISALAPSPDAERVAGFSNSRMWVWDMQGFLKGRSVSSPRFCYTARLRVSQSLSRNRPLSRLSSAVYSPGGNFLLTTIYHHNSRRSSIVVWNLSGGPLGRITGHDKEVTDIRFVGNKLVSISQNGTLLVWDWPKISAQFTRKETPANGS